MSLTSPEIKPMNFRSLEADERILHLKGHPRRHATQMHQLYNAYLKYLYLTCHAVLKPPHLASMQHLWLNLPSTSLTIGTTQIQQTLDSVFKVENIDVDKLPPLEQTEIATILITGSGKVDWTKLTEIAVNHVANTMPDRYETKQAVITHNWMRREVNYTFDTIATVISNANRRR